MTDFTSSKLALVVGAGSTLCDAQSKTLKEKPPLDRGFFSVCEKLGNQELYPTIKKYLQDHYAIDPSHATYDSLERVMAVIYADIHSPELGEKSLETFRSLLRLFNRRIAETTNPMKVTNRGGLYRIVAKKLKQGYRPDNITIITLNQDIQIEKTLERLEETKQYAKLGTLISFPYCYRLAGAGSMLTTPPENQPKFRIDEEDKGGISVLKLHGSLNWFSTHVTNNIPRNAVLSRNKKFKITPRSIIPTTMRMQVGKKRMYTLPLIVPPVNHKAAIIHDNLRPLWHEAEKQLTEADEIIVFGYSCPATDFESANLLRRATNSKSKAKDFSIIDPSHEAFTRYIQVTCLDRLSYFRSCDAYVSA